MAFNASFSHRDPSPVVSQLSCLQSCPRKGHLSACFPALMGSNSLLALKYCLPTRKDSTESRWEPCVPQKCSAVATVFQDLGSPLDWLLLKPSAPQHWPCPSVGSLLVPECCCRHLCILVFAGSQYGTLSATEQSWVCGCPPCQWVARPRRFSRVRVR